MNYREAKKLKTGDIVCVIPQVGYIPITVEILRTVIAEKDVLIQCVKYWPGNERSGKVDPNIYRYWYHHKSVIEKIDLQ